MSEKVEEIYNSSLADLPGDLRPFVRSLLVSRIAAHFEKSHDEKTGKAWLVNSVLLEEELTNPDKDSVFERAVSLVTLPKGKDENAEWYYRWLRGNGLDMLRRPVLKDQLKGLLDDPDRGNRLAAQIDSFLDTNVSGFTMTDLSDVPEGYALFITFFVCFNMHDSHMSSTRQRLFDKAINRISHDAECMRVMGLFGEIEDTIDLYSEFTQAAKQFTPPSATS